jgi:hypothetical protein
MFINKITKEYPTFIGDLQLLYPDATLDNVPDDWALVEESPMPEYQSGEGIFETEPQQVNGVWKQQWLVRDLTTEEITKIEAHNLKVREFLDQLEAVQNEN